MQIHDKGGHRSPLTGCIIEGEECLSQDTFRGILNELGLYDRMTAAHRIAIKPNFAGGSEVAPDSHIVTDVRLLRELVTLIEAINPSCEICIAESDSAGHGWAFLKFKHLGLDTWQLPRVRLLDLSRDVLRRIELPAAKYFTSPDRQLWLSDTWMDADVTISIANLKTHSVTKFTGTCKNLFGLLPRADKEVYHPSIDKVIHDLVRATPPDLSILDGFFAMEGDGPVLGHPVSTHCRIFACSPERADVVGCRMIGVNPKGIKHLRYLASADVLRAETGCPRYSFRRPGKRLRLFNSVGLAIQRVGAGLYAYGNRAHCATSLLLFAYLTARPLILLFFKVETLRQWKRRWRG